MRYFVMLILVCSFLYAEAVISHDWENDNVQAQIGAQSIAVNDSGIYVLCNLSHKILLFSHRGKLLDEISYVADGCGLAVDTEGNIAVYSPMAKTVTFVAGENKGTVKKVDQLPAISEVWKENGSWWARCGWQVAAIDQEGASTSLCQKSFSIDEQVVLQQNSEVDLVFSFAKDTINVKPIAQATQEQKLYVDVLANGEHRIFICNTQAQIKKANAIQSSTTEFRHFYIYGGKLYQLTNVENGFTVTCDTIATKDYGSATTQRHRERVVEQRSVSATDAPTYIDVLFTNEGVVRRVRLQDYLKNVVSAEIYGSWSLEAHRAMAVTARTYAIGRKRHSNANVCTTTHCQAWKADVTSKASQGVDDTNGVVIYHNGRVISEALYFAHCNGRTRNSEEKWNYNPYLRSKYCACGKKSYYGHGVGACQWGLQAYSQQGWSYKQILEHYFTNTVVK